MTSQLNQELRVWFDVEIGHSHCPEDETEANCKVNGLLAVVEQYGKEFIDEV